MYTQEQINGMTQDQLKAAIMALQGQQSATSPIVAEASTATAPETQEVATTPTTDTINAVQTDIDKINEKIAALKQDGAELYADAITALEAKRDDLVAAAKAEINQAETEVKSFADHFKDKYLPWVEGAAVLIVLLRVFGVI